MTNTNTNCLFTYINAHIISSQIITPVNIIREHLHCLPIPQRVHFKLDLLVYKCLRGGAPPHLAEMLVQNSDVPALRSLRSTARGCLVIPRTKTVTIGPRGFAAAGPTFWNSLSAHLRDDSISLPCFKSSLKAYLFK